MTDKPHLFPATYQAPLTRQVKPFLKALSLGLLMLSGRGQLTHFPPVWILIIVSFAVAMLLLQHLNEGLSRVTLYEDHIEKQTWFSKMNWPREDVASIDSDKYGGFRLVHRYNRGYWLTVPPGIERDAAWDAWLAHVPPEQKAMPLLRRISRWFRRKDVKINEG